MVYHCVGDDKKPCQLELLGSSQEIRELFLFVLSGNLINKLEFLSSMGKDEGKDKGDRKREKESLQIFKYRQS